MKFQPLSEKKKAELEYLHRHERDSRICDRIKAVLLKSEGWKNRDIAQALRLHEETVRKHIEDWILEEKLKPEK